MVVNDDNTNVANQGKTQQGQAYKMWGMRTIRAPKNGSPTTVVNILFQGRDNHALIVAQQQEMNTLKQKNA